MPLSLFRRCNNYSCDIDEDWSEKYLAENCQRLVFGRTPNHSEDVLVAIEERLFEAFGYGGLDEETEIAFEQLPVSTYKIPEREQRAYEERCRNELELAISIMFGKIEVHYGESDDAIYIQPGNILYWEF